MSASPPKDADLEQAHAQAAAQAQQQQQQNQQSPHPNTANSNGNGNGEGPMESGDPHAAGMGYEFEVKEQDRWLPIANVARIMKTALPENAKIAKEAKECMQECVSEFISFITSEASEKCHQEKRKTVNGEDILFAMTSLGFENYAEALKIYLAKYRESQSARSENQHRPSSQSGPSGQAAQANAQQSQQQYGNASGTQANANVPFEAQPGGENQMLGGQEDDPNAFGLYGDGLGGVGQNGVGGGGAY